MGEARKESLRSIILYVTVFYIRRTQSFRKSDRQAISEYAFLSMFEGGKQKRSGSVLATILQRDFCYVRN